MKILVVDDTEANRKLLAWMLEDDGHEVIEAEDGRQAVTLFAEYAPDLVLMDVMMPVMDGFEATKAIKEQLQGQHVPIIFLTALSDDASLTKCLSIGGDDFLSKPINEQVLQAKIKAHTRIKDLNEQLSRQNIELTRLHQYTLREQEIAKSVFEKALAASIFDSRNPRHYMSPAATFNGDLLLVSISPSGGLYALMADFTGHGLPAAIGALPVSHAFLEAAQQGASVSSIAREVNKTLEKFLPDDMFAAAAIAELNADGTRLTLWLGGLPDALLTDARGALKQRIVSTHMPLGILEDQEFEREPEIIEVARGDRLYLYTDGIPEARNPAGEMYGDQRLLQHFDGGSEDTFGAIIADVTGYSGGSHQQDDITLLELSCMPVQPLPGAAANTPRSAPNLPWTLTMELGIDELRKRVSPVSQIVDMIGMAPGVEPHKDYLHTILAELFANALEHGVLGLDSRLKQTEEGYLAYYREREQRLATLEQGQLGIQVSFRAAGDQGHLTLSLHDSGPGFDWQRPSSAGDDAAFGRGMALIDILCDKVTYSAGGTRVDAEYSLRD